MMSGVTLLIYITGSIGHACTLISQMADELSALLPYHPSNMRIAIDIRTPIRKPDEKSLGNVMYLIRTEFSKLDNPKIKCQ